MGLRRELELYLAAQLFLTRLPAPGYTHETGQLAAASRYFPAVGLLVGLIAGLVWLIAGLTLPPLVAAGLATGAMILATGALHEDGFADCCDGLGGGATRERALEIMRDSRIGVYGAVGVAMTLGLRWAALGAMAPWEGFAALLIAPAAGRAAVTLVMGLLPYAREDGAARDAKAGATPGDVIVAGGTAALAGLILGGWAGQLAAALALGLGWLWATYLRRRLGGHTGDGLGAAEQIGHIAALVVLSA